MATNVMGEIDLQSTHFTRVRVPSTRSREISAYVEKCNCRPINRSVPLIPVGLGVQLLYAAGAQATKVPDYLMDACEPIN